MSCVCRSFCCCFASYRRTEKNLKNYVALKDYKNNSEGFSGEFHNVPVEQIFHTSPGKKEFPYKHALYKHIEYPHEENVQIASFLLSPDGSAPSKYGSTSQPMSRKATIGTKERRWSTSSTESEVDDRSKFLVKTLENPQKAHYRSRSPSPQLSGDEDSHFTRLPHHSKMSQSPSLDLAQFRGPQRPSSPCRPSSALGLSAASGDSSDELEDTPTLQFSLYYDIQRRTLTVHLQKAYNLPVKGVDMRACNSFVVLFLLPSREEILQTPVVEKDLNPVFDQVFEFRGILSQELYQQVLVLQVFDHDKFLSDDLIGTVLIPMKEAELYGMTMKRKIGEGKEMLKVVSHLLVLACNLPKGTPPLKMNKWVHFQEKVALCGDIRGVSRKEEGEGVEVGWERGKKKSEDRKGGGR